MAPPSSPKKPSASQVARDPKKFNVWRRAHNCISSTMDDLPDSHREVVDDIFNVNERLPFDLVNPKSKCYESLKYIQPDVLKFLERAYAENSDLFSKKVPFSEKIIPGLISAYQAWSQNELMNHSSTKWSEADRAGQVHNPLRNSAILKSRLRLQKRIHLPLPLDPPQESSSRRLTASVRYAIPDGMITPTPTHLRTLSHGASCSFNALKSLVPEGILFAQEATLMDTVPEGDKFEFASSIWEDKKPSQSQLLFAYRQNLMSTTASLRQLHAFNIDTPVIGLVWGRGRVAAHIDWVGKQRGLMNIFSAQYSTEDAANRRESGRSCTSSSADAPGFHSWDLAKPSDVLAVHLLVRNIDNWTATVFRDRCVHGIKSLVKELEKGTRPFAPWKGRRSVSGPVVPLATVDEEDTDAADGPAQAVEARAPRKNVVTRSPDDENAVQKTRKKAKPAATSTTGESSTTVKRTGLRVRK